MTNTMQKHAPLWRPLEEKGYRRLFAGQLLSDFGNWLDFIALSALIVYAWGHGSMALAALSICIGLPYVVVGPFMSVRTQRMPGKTIMIVCDLLRAGTAVGLAFAPSLPVLLALVLVKYSVSATFDPLRQGAVKRLVAPATLAQASSLSQMAANLTKIVGPAAGGALLSGLGTTAPFFASAAMYALSAIMLAAIPAWSGAASEEKKEKASLRAAWRHMLGRPTLRGAILFASSMFFLVFLYDGLFPLLTKEAGMDESRLGLLVGAVGAGSVVGALVAGQWSGWQRRPLAYMAGASLASGTLIVSVGLAAAEIIDVPLAVWLLAFAGLGFTGAQSAVPFGYVLQSETDEATVGPVSALAGALQTSSMLVAPVIGAALAGWLGIGGVLIAIGAVTVVAAGGYRFVGAAAGRTSGKSAKAAAESASS
ncbi:MFS transporter [Paenibacillus aurantiacus]|uniref:MFS transporter n=1 Tax=Paenibacillus aurantiacus TaxID=1936118 RepID=A0ABV5KQ45_9BACL